MSDHPLSGIPRCIPEIRYPMKGKEIRIMIARCPALFIIKGSSGDKDDILVVKLPVGILESMFLSIGVMKQNTVYRP